ncbi:MAG TPA: hotdog domain-containing protein [Acidimicrobiia bacterium]|jgi:uncharacterized protein (TIGR00369 family)|nr:hotdog domain-containing protein [Acidimicrobiia bacterium]
MTSEPTTEPIAYPPEQHLLRDLRFSFEHDEPGRASRAWLPIVPELCTDHGHARVGPLATLVDVIGGGLAANAAAPDWIATADLTIHLVRGAPAGSTVEARAAVQRKGRTTVVMDVQLLDDDERELGIATMSFSVLPRRDTNPTMETMNTGPTTMARPESRLPAPIPEMLAIDVRDAARGELDVPVTDWCRNSMGAMQGGVVAMVVECAAETALRAAGEPNMVVADLELTYLGFGRVGPIRTHVDVLGRDAAHVELVDTGADPRRMTLARATGTRGLA